jgi:hypothetical protein
LLKGNSEVNSAYKEVALKAAISTYDWMEWNRTLVLDINAWMNSVHTPTYST